MYYYIAIYLDELDVPKDFKGDPNMDMAGITFFVSKSKDLRDFMIRKMVGLESLPDFRTAQHSNITVGETEHEDRLETIKNDLMNINVKNYFWDDSDDDDDDSDGDFDDGDDFGPDEDDGTGGISLPKPDFPYPDLDLPDAPRLHDEDEAKIVDSTGNEVSVIDFIDDLARKTHRDLA